MSKEIDLLNITLQEKNAEIKKLQKQLSDIERDRHTEMVKLRLEVITLFKCLALILFVFASMMLSFLKYKNKQLKCRIHLHPSAMIFLEE